MKTIRYEVEADAKFLTNRWCMRDGGISESDLAQELLSARENQREADCKVLCSYCDSDNYASAVRYIPGVWGHTAIRDGYSPVSTTCDASQIREAWFVSFAPTVEQIVAECVESIIKDIPQRCEFDAIWNGVSDKAMAEIRADWGRIVTDAIERYQREGVK